MSSHSCSSRCFCFKSASSVCRTAFPTRRRHRRALKHFSCASPSSSADCFAPPERSSPQRSAHPASEVHELPLASEALAHQRSFRRFVPTRFSPSKMRTEMCHVRACLAGLRSGLRQLMLQIILASPGTRRRYNVRCACSIGLRTGLGQHGLHTKKSPVSRLFVASRSLSTRFTASFLPQTFPAPAARDTSPQNRNTSANPRSKTRA